MLAAKKMKLLFLITRADTVGGAQIHVRDIAHALIKQGHEVLVVTGPKGKYTTDLESCEIPTVQCKTLINNYNIWQDLQSLVFVKDIIDKFQPDLVSTISSKAGVLGRLACHITGIPCLFTVQGWSFTDGVPEPNRTLHMVIEKMVAPLAEKIICVSEYDRMIGIKSGMPSSRLQVIHNGVPDIPYELRANPGAPTSPIRIVMVARFDRQKDHVTLLRAFKEISKSQLDLCLDLCGEGPNLQNIQKLVVKMGLAERVNFLGYRTDIPQILAKAHIFTLISNWEGFPLSIVEAMRAGLPVVVSKVGGASEAVVEGQTGYCVPRGDFDLLRDRLIKLVEQAELREKMGNLGRQRYEEKFTFERMFERTLNIYYQVIVESRKKKCI
ncbi:MAG: glycosyltransferase family 4 protein [Oscillatoriaceae bacterium SKYG93]|nr:glycosyltransferase family 4 protein [Oscillatoriaceae bacterium SKYG93]MDW8452699.1 glycosyltransferase family 4 protein [Oscillatoriaceae cyanobacterium SKYGB_i_bin93]